MPTYDYKCENCGSTFEIFQSIKDEPLKLCSHCGHETLVKIISTPAGLIFKGSGFYLTDYVKKNSSSPDSDKKSSTTTGKAEKSDTKKKDKSDKKDK